MAASVLLDVYRVYIRLRRPSLPYQKFLHFATKNYCAVGLKIKNTLSINGLGIFVVFFRCGISLVLLSQGVSRPCSEILVRKGYCRASEFHSGAGE